MAMRMSPAVASQPALPGVNRTGLVFFAGVALIVAHFVATNKASGADLGSVFFGSHQQQGRAVPVAGLQDLGLQLVGITLLTLLAQYGGDDASLFALWFVLALWLLFLLVHFGGLGQPAATSPATLRKPAQQGK